MTTETGDIHVGEVGTVFEITIKEGGVGVDISTATQLQITFKKPTGESLVKTAVFTTDGTDFKLRYVSIADDLDVDGPWQLQARVDMPSWQGYSTIGHFQVEPNL